MFKALGLIDELEPEATANLPSLRSLQGRLPSEQVLPIVSYLKSGAIVCDAMEMCVDPFDRTKRIPGGSGLQSDGEWVWRQDLYYYVERYAVWLDPKFVSHALDDPPSSFSLDQCEQAMRSFSSATRADGA